MTATLRIPFRAAQGTEFGLQTRSTLSFPRLMFRTLDVFSESSCASRMPIKKKEAGCPVAGRKKRTLFPGEDRDLSPSFGG